MHGKLRSQRFHSGNEPYISTNIKENYLIIPAGRQVGALVF